jgi:hypothetical protein
VCSALQSFTLLGKEFLSLPLALSVHFLCVWWCLPTFWHPHSSLVVAIFVMQDLFCVAMFSAHFSFGFF